MTPRADPALQGAIIFGQGVLGQQRRALHDRIALVIGVEMAIGRARRRNEVRLLRAARPAHLLRCRKPGKRGCSESSQDRPPRERS